jgi:nitric oxide reductase activation protein
MAAASRPHRRAPSSNERRIREELHAAHLITTPAGLARIPRFDRPTIIRHFTDEIARFPHRSIINVVVAKDGKPDDFDEGCRTALSDKRKGTPKRPGGRRPGGRSRLSEPR